MPFTPPTYNLDLRVWNAGHTPLADPPDIEGLLCQLYVHNKPNQEIIPEAFSYYLPPIIVRTPNNWQPRHGDTYEIGENTVTYYAHRFGHLCHQGFPNEYWQIIVEMCEADATTVMYQQLLP